eukprot:COSAG01_NODE_3408_length_6127_cov_61.919210_1_plen_71_part_10
MSMGGGGASESSGSATALARVQGRPDVGDAGDAAGGRGSPTAADVRLRLVAAARMESSDTLGIGLPILRCC